MTALLLALVTACTSPSTGPSTGAVTGGSFPEVDLRTTGSVAPSRLYLDPLISEAAYDLADSNVPHGITTTVEAPITGRRSTIVPLPFSLDGEGRKTIGQDLKIVTDKGVQVRYVSLGGGQNTWRLIKDRVEIKAKGAATVTLTYSKVADVMARRTLEGSGLEPSAFVRMEHTRHGDTRPGLMLTSPSTATWDLQLPDKAVFKAFPAIDIPPVLAKSDGVRVLLEIVEGDTVTEVGRMDLQKLELQKWTVDLSAWGGKKVGVRLRTEVMGTPDYDTVFIGTPTLSAPPTSEVRRVLVIGLDTTRPDHLSWSGYPRLTTPELDALANTSGVFTHAWTPAPRTRPSFRSATTGRYPLLAIGATNIGEVFQRNGFATAGFVANIHLQPRFDFQKGFDIWFFDGQSNSEKQVDKALRWFGANQDRDTYMFLHIMDPHLVYHAPPPYKDEFVEDPDPTLPRVFTKNQVKSWGRDGTLTDQRKAHIESLYDGELRFTSAQIGRLITQLDKLPGKTMVVVHSDHGEEFWEHGGFEHNHTLFEETTRGLLWFRPPGGTDGGAKVSEQPSTLADIAPTLYDYLGFENLPETDGISLRPWLEGKAPESRPIGISHLRHGMDRWGVVLDGSKYILHTGSGEEELYTLPNETDNKAKSADLAPYREALLNAHPGLRGGPGWRVQVQQVPAFSLILPKKARDAGVLDPDLTSRHRANLSWGEPSKHTPEQLGHVTLSEQGKRFTYTPGEKPNGILWVLFDDDVDPADVELDFAGKTTLYKPAMGHTTATGGKLRIRPGYVIVPPPGEAARMAALRQGTHERSAEETCRLCALGYMVGDGCTSCK